MSQAEARYDVSFGDVRDAQIVIGDHTTVVTPDGVKVVRIVGGSPSRPKRRAAPVGQRPVPAPLVGRVAELELARRAAPGWPLQLAGAEGIGKTAVLKHVAAGAPPGPVVYAVARRRSLDDLQGMLFRAFWETEERFVPAPDEMPDYLGQAESLVVLDDLPLDRDDLVTLLDSAPRCTFVVAGTERTLWTTGAYHELRGLAPDESVKLMERVLGRALAGEERAAAIALAGERGGRPQSLVEIAALVLDRRVSLVDLSAGPAAEIGPSAEAGLTAGERRVLGALGSLSGAALGSEHVSAIAGTPDAHTLLDKLERSGWVKSQSPRYRLARALPANAERVPLTTLVQQLAGWARVPTTAPEQVAEESEAIEAVVTLALDDGRNDLAVDLARASEAKLATAGLLGAWERVLEAGLGAARAGGPAHVADEAYMLHELGSRAIAVRGPAARELLTAALEIRERIGDHAGAELTRHNLAQLEGPPGSNGHGRPRWPRIGPALAIVAVLGAAGAAAALLVHGGGGDTTARPVRAPVPPAPSRGQRPNIVITSPRQNGRYEQGSWLLFSYGCRAAAGGRPRSCTARLSDHGSVRSGARLLLGSNQYVLVVTARDEHHSRRKRVRFVVVDPRSVPPDTTATDTTDGTGEEPPGTDTTDGTGRKPDKKSPRTRSTDETTP